MVSSFHLREKATNDVHTLLTYQSTNTELIGRSISHLQPASARRNGAGEGVRAGDVDERGAGAGLPGGGGRRVRGGQHRLQGHGAQEPRAPRQKPVRPNACFPGRGSPSLRVTRDLKVCPPQVQDGRGRPAEGGQPKGDRDGGRVDGGGRAHLQAGPVPHRVRVPLQPHYVRHPHQREGSGREPRETEEGVRGLRGAPLQARVPRRGLRQLRGPQPVPLHLLLHGDATRGSIRLVSARQGMVGAPHGQTVH